MTSVTFIYRMAIGKGKDGIMHCEPGRFPFWQGGMAFYTIRGYSSSNVIGIACGIKIGLMAGEAIG